MKSEADTIRLNLLKHYAGLVTKSPVRTVGAVSTNFLQRAVFTKLVNSGLIEGYGADWDTALFFTTPKGIVEINRLERVG